MSPYKFQIGQRVKITWSGLNKIGVIKGHYHMVVTVFYAITLDDGTQYIADENNLEAL